MSSPFFTDFDIHTTALNIYNITEFSREHPFFNAGYLFNIPISTDIDVWDVRKWDIAKWDIGGAVTTNSLWTSVGKTGHVVAPEVQLTFGYAAVPVVELVSIDVEFHVGARVA